MSFTCEKCRYKSSREKIPTKCPYCGTEGTVHKNETAAELIIESA